MDKKRPSWDEYFKEIVQVTAKRSPCERLKVGCLLVKDNRIISQGYNGFLPGCSHKSIVCPTLLSTQPHSGKFAIVQRGKG